MEKEEQNNEEMQIAEPIMRGLYMVVAHRIGKQPDKRTFRRDVTNIYREHINIELEKMLDVLEILFR